MSFDISNLSSGFDDDFLMRSDASYVHERTPWDVLDYMDREIKCREDLAKSNEIVFLVAGIVPAILSATFLGISILIYVYVKRYYTALLNEARTNLHEVMDNVMVSAIPMKVLAVMSGLQFGRDGLDWRASPSEPSRRRGKRTVKR